MRPLLVGPEPSETDILKQRIEDLEQELQEAREHFEKERAERIEVLRKSPEVRKLYVMLRLLFEGTGMAEVSIPQGSDPSQPIPSSIYDAWKQRLPPACGRVIDALLIQPMGFNQIKNYCKMGTSTVEQALAKLRANNLIEKDGSLNRLKRN